MSSVIRNLACAIVLQAVKDYFDSETTPADQTEILKDLRSKWMDYITDGTSVVVAEQLELHPDEIRARIKNEEEQL